VADIRKWALPATAVGSKAPQRPAYVPVDGDDDGRVRRTRETRSLMRWSRKARCIATIVAVGAAVVPALCAADAQARRVQVGALTCSLSAGVGLIVGSQRNVSCLFRGRTGEPDEPYTGTMTRVGLDVGATVGSVIIWAVFADTNRYKGMLTGSYTGASAEMSIAAGLGANVLVGGSNRTVALQPLSMQGQIGLDIAAGVGTLDLHPSW